MSKNITVSAGRALCGKITVISSKSELHRLIFCACLSEHGCAIRYNSSLSKDIEATISCFRALGAEISVSEDEISVIRPLDIEHISDCLEKDIEIYCNESGSTARFIMPLLSLVCKSGAVMTGAGKLPTRPFSDLCECLSAHGAVFSSTQMPIHIIRCADGKGTFEISGNVSSQYLSGLLFVLPLMKDARICLTTPLESCGYVDMTVEAMAKFGVTVTEKDGVYTCKGRYTSPDKTVVAGGDWSNAAFFLCGAGDKKVTVDGIMPSSLQPDRYILDILSFCGFNIEKGEDFVSVSRTEKTQPFEIDAGETPDLVPILCVLGASLCGTSKIHNIRRLRFKESDRVKAVCDMISSLGGNISADSDTIYICGTGKLSGGTADGYGDHRIVMSSAIAASICENDVTIIGSDAVTKSYPDFFEILKTLSEEC